MTIYGYLVTYTDHTDYKEYKDYGFVAAESRADAVQEVENEYLGDYATIEEISVHSVVDDENSYMIGKYQIDFFIDAARQNGYGEEGN